MHPLTSAVRERKEMTMKTLTIAAFAAGLLASPAFANELEDYCTAYVTENGGDVSGCTCLAEEADDAMTQELLAVQSDEDVENLSDASKEAIADCFPTAG